MDQLASSGGGGGKSTAGKKNWLRHRLFNMSKGSLKDDDDSDATSRASSAADLQVTHLHSDLPVHTIFITAYDCKFRSYVRVLDMVSFLHSA